VRDEFFQNIENSQKIAILHCEFSSELNVKNIRLFELCVTDTSNILKIQKSVHCKHVPSEFSREQTVENVCLHALCAVTFSRTMIMLKNMRILKSLSDKHVTWQIQ